MTSLQQNLQLEQIAGCDMFTGRESDRTPWGRVFGGQVMAQSLVAAVRTVSPGLRLHSLHGYFILAGITGVPLLFDVKRVRDGKSFATRTVTALQRNEAIFQLTASFHKEEWGPSFQIPGHTLFSLLKQRGVTRLRSPEELLADGAVPFPISHADVRGDTEAVTLAEGDWWLMQWGRHKSKLPNDGEHEAMLAWMSDSHMADIVWKPYAKTHNVQYVVSLDHSIHFHSPCRADEWHLYDVVTTVSSGSRGHARAEVFARSGEIVATVTQEALVRVPREEQEAHRAKL